MKLALSGRDSGQAWGPDGQTQVGLGLCLPSVHCLVGGSHGQSCQVQGAAHGRREGHQGSLGKARRRAAS